MCSPPVRRVHGSRPTPCGAVGVDRGHAGGLYSSKGDRIRHEISHQFYRSLARAQGSNENRYVYYVFSNNLYRIPVDAAGKAGPPVDIWMDQPVKGDGMRAANGKLLFAENGSGKISVLTVNGDKASVKVIKEGLKTPIAVDPAGDTIWIAERGAGKAVSIPSQ